MEFKSAASIEEIVWNMKLMDMRRNANRALINDLFNGLPPYTEAEQAQNRINTNVNWLDANRIAHDARRQYSQAFLKPGNYFTVKLDRGPIHKRTQWGEIITIEANKRLKRSTPYAETLRNVFAQLVLHGVGPVTWEDKHDWCPSMQMMGDVLLPSRTLRSMQNLSYFAVYRRYTASELYKKTHGVKVDKGWNMPVVEKCIKWAHEQYGKTNASNESTYSPEKWAEDIKADSGLYSSDQVPTIDCWDFYFLQEDKKEFGWKRRIILDTPSISQADGAGVKGSKNIIGTRGEYLFDPGDRNYARSLREIIHFQFADGSVVAPFRYHSVRSLGFLLYAVCQLQNRLRCKFNDSVFENLLQYFRVANPEDMQRLKKVDLVNMGIIPDGLNFVKQEERWQINENMVMAGMNLNRQSIAEHSSSFNQDFGLNPEKQSQDKTATQIAAEVNASNATVGGMLGEAYIYQTPQYEEICRRLCIKNSRNLDAREFRDACLKQGVPEKYLNSECWQVSPEQVIGNGNKTVELAQTNLLMSQIDRFDPDAQRIILRRWAFAVVDAPALADELVPENKTITTNSVHDAQLAAGTLLLGLPMNLKQGVNHGEYAATLLGMMNATIQRINQNGGVATADQILGLQNIAGQDIEGQTIEGNGAAPHIGILAQEKSNKPMVKQLSDILSKQMNEVRAFAQRLEEQQKDAAQNGHMGMAPEDAVKLKAQLVLAETKADLMRQSGEMKLEQKQQSHEQKLQQNQEKHETQMGQQIRQAQVQEAATDIKTAADIRREGPKLNGQAEST